VQYHPISDYIVTGGYDKIARLYDIERQQIVKTFTGHKLSISHSIFTPLGNLILTGSKACTVKFWDIVSGLCIKTITTHLGEVTGLDVSTCGNYLLTCSKDNSNRLWDVRMMRPVRKYKGHQNTCKNFIKASFAGDSLVAGGSEDGMVYIWDRENGEVMQRLRHHNGISYSCRWNSKQNLFASCSEDGTAATWWFNHEIGNKET
jgi:WD40 repeat protein